MRQALGTAVGAGDGVELGQRVMCAAAVAAALRVLALWMWGPETFSFIHTSDGHISARLFGYEL